MSGFLRSIKRQRDGTYAIRLLEVERRILAELPVQLARLVEAEPGDPALQRLFPTAYPHDPEREQEWRLLMSVDLHDKRQAQLRALAETAEARSLTEEELSLWAQAFNDLRLFIGTRLDVSEETSHEDFDDEEEQWLFAVYEHLAHLQGQAIDALSEALPAEGDPAAPQETEG